MTNFNCLLYFLDVFETVDNILQLAEAGFGHNFHCQFLLLKVTMNHDPSPTEKQERHGSQVQTRTERVLGTLQCNFIFEKSS